MCASTVNYTRKNCGIVTEKLAFEYDKSISSATTNLNQENPSMTIYHLLLTVSKIPYWMCLNEAP